MSENARSMIYTTLKLENDEFRLLRLLPSSRGEHIKGELRTVSIHDKSVNHKAVSYQWGQDEPSLEILLDDHPILVRKNLHGFLVQMNLEQRENWFFINALVTNQDDSEEKASQVTMMGRIYREAEEVFAWIQREPFHRVDGVKCASDEDPATPDADQEDSLDRLKSLVLHTQYLLVATMDCARSSACKKTYVEDWQSGS